MIDDCNFEFQVWVGSNERPRLEDAYNIESKPYDWLGRRGPGRPYGEGLLWTSTLCDGSSPWLRFLEDAGEWGRERAERGAHLLRVRPDAHVFHVSTRDQWDDLVEAYPSGVARAVNWADVARDFDGVYMHPRAVPFDGLDVDQTVWFSALSALEYVRPLRLEIEELDYSFKTRLNKMNPPPLSKRLKEFLLAVSDEAEEEGQNRVAIVLRSIAENHGFFFDNVIEDLSEVPKDVIRDIKYYMGAFIGDLQWDDSAEVVVGGIYGNVIHLEQTQTASVNLNEYIEAMEEDDDDEFEWANELVEILDKWREGNE